MSVFYDVLMEKSASKRLADAYERFISTGRISKAHERRLKGMFGEGALNPESPQGTRAEKAMRGYLGYAQEPTLLPNEKDVLERALRQNRERILQDPKHQDNAFYNTFSSRGLGDTKNTPYTLTEYSGYTAPKVERTPSHYDRRTNRERLEQDDISFLRRPPRTEPTRPTRVQRAVPETEPDRPKPPERAAEKPVTKPNVTTDTRASIDDVVDTPRSQAQPVTPTMLHNRQAEGTPQDYAANLLLGSRVQKSAPRPQPSPQPKAQPSPQPKPQPSPQPKAQPSPQPSAEQQSNLKRNLLLAGAGLTAAGGAGYMYHRRNKKRSEQR